MEWIISPIADTNYIMDSRLRDCRKIILVTYETASKRRYVKQIECYHGRVMKKLVGRLLPGCFSQNHIK